jgi:hypothetical protein
MGFFVAVCGIVAFWILWESGYRRRWLQYRARNWQTLPGKFDEGEIVPMMGARSSVGYEVRLGYDYQADEDRPGIYTLPFYGIFSTEKEAEECRQLVASRIIPVRVSSRKPRKSIVLDEDVKPLLPRQSASPSH